MKEKDKEKIFGLVLKSTDAQSQEQLATQKRRNPKTKQKKKKTRQSIGANFRSKYQVTKNMMLINYTLCFKLRIGIGL